MPTLNIETPTGKNDLLPVCLTVGDPLGIGPEITVKFLQWLVQQQKESAVSLRPVCVTGSLKELEQASSQLNISLPQSGALVSYQDISSAACSRGDIAFQSVTYAIESIFNQKASFLLTGPISKESLKLAGLPFTGHTEILETLAGQYFPQEHHQADMVFLYRHFRMLLLTRHVPLGLVPEVLTEISVTQSLLNLIDFLNVYEQQSAPKISVLGVNPHAGELAEHTEAHNVGDEEVRVLNPAIQRVSKMKRLEIQPPVAADAAFRGFSMDTLDVDAYVAAYHDQGLIPFKMIAGFDAVNVTIGLPFLRTSVGHGTAPDIAGLGVAKPDSMIAAYKTGCSLYHNARSRSLV